MEDIVLVAVLEGVEDLQEDALDQLVLVVVQVTVDERIVKVASGAVLEHDVHEVLALVHLVELHDVRMVRDGLVRRDLALLEDPPVRPGVCLLEDLHGELARLAGLGLGGGGVDTAVDDAVGAFAELLNEADAAVTDGLAVEVGESVARFGSHVDAGDVVGQRGHGVEWWRRSKRKCN